MMIARRRIIESLSKVARWIYKAGNRGFEGDSFAVLNEGLSFSAPSGQRLVLSPFYFEGVNTYPDGTEERFEKYAGGYVNIGDKLEHDSTFRYDFTPYKKLVIEVESGSGVIGYGPFTTRIPKDENTHIVNPQVKLEFNGPGKYVMDISKVNSLNLIVVGTSKYLYGSPRLIVSNIYFM